MSDQLSTPAMQEIAAPPRRGTPRWMVRASTHAVLGVTVAVWVAAVVGAYQLIRDVSEPRVDRIALAAADLAPAAAPLTLADIAAITALSPAAGATEDGQAAATSVADAAHADVLARASRLIRRVGDDAITMLSNRALTPAQRAREFRKLLLQSFDVETISRLALGRHGRTASPSQFAEYERLFEDFVVATYSRRFASYSGETLAIKTARLANKGIVVVATEIARTDGPPVRVDWLVRERDGAPKVVDVVVAGVSMAITHRSEFAAVINRAGGLDGLIAELRAKTSS